MFSSIRSYIAGAVAVVIAILAGLVKYQSRRADNAEEKAEKAEVRADKAKVLNEVHKEAVKIDEAIANESEEDLRAPSDDSRT